MRVYIASDHAGYRLKEKIQALLVDKGYNVEDFGAYREDPGDDYPDYVKKAAEAVSKTPGSRGIVFGGSGQGEAMVANKIKNIRASVFYGPMLPTDVTEIEGSESNDPYEMLRLTRAHNDANMLSIGARFVTEEQAEKAVLLFLESQFSGHERHLRRIAKMQELDSQ